MNQPQRPNIEKVISNESTKGSNKDNRKQKSLIEQKLNNDSNEEKKKSFHSNNNIEVQEEKKNKQNKLSNDNNLRDQKISQKRSIKDIGEKKSELRSQMHEYSRQNNQRQISSFFNEHDLQRAPSLFDKHEKTVFQNQLECQMPDMVEQKKDEENEQKNEYYQDSDQSKFVEQQNSQNSSPIKIQRKSKYSKTQIWFTNLKRQLYIVFEDPMITTQGRYIHFIIQFFILLSVCLIIADSSFYDEENQTLYDSVSAGLESVIFTVFLIEFVLRLIVYNSFGEKIINFFKKPMNIIDLISLLPFFIDSIIIAASNYYSYKVGFLRVIRIIRLIRIVRIFKLSRYLKGLDTLLKSLNVSRKYFSFVCATLGVFVVFISTIIYYFEKSFALSTDQLKQQGIDPNTQIKSIPQSVWFVLTTIATLGYGDKLPLTLPSKICSGLIVLVSQSFVIGLPIAIVGFDFSNVFKEEKEQELFFKQREEVNQFSKENYKIKELQFMQQRLKKISKTNKLVRELSSRSSKMCYLITKDLVGLYVQVVLNEQRQFQQRMQNLQLTGHQNIAQLQKFFGSKAKIKMQDLKVKQCNQANQQKENLKSTVSHNESPNISENESKNNNENENTEIEDQNLEASLNDKGIKDKFVRSNFKRIQTLLISNVNGQRSQMLGKKLTISHQDQNSPFNFKKKNQIQDQHIQQSQDLKELDKQFGKRKLIESQFNPILVTSPKDQNKRKRQSSNNKDYQNQIKYGQASIKTFPNIKYPQKGINSKQNIPNSGDDYDSMPEILNQLDFLNEILMDLVSEESIIIKSKKQELDEFSEACSEVDDENAYFFEIEKFERKKIKQKRILTKNFEKPQEDKKQGIDQKARKHAKARTMIQEVTEHNESLEQNEILKQLSNQNNSSDKGNNINFSNKFDFFDQETNRIKLDNELTNRNPLSASRLLSDQIKETNITKQSDTAEHHFDNNTRLKIHQSNQQGDSYYNIFDNRLSKGKSMIKATKKKSSKLLRANTMFVKNINISKSHIEGFIDEKDNNNSSITGKSKDSIKKQIQSNNHINIFNPNLQNAENKTLMNLQTQKKSNSLNLSFQQLKLDQIIEQNKKDYNKNYSQSDFITENILSPDENRSSNSKFIKRSKFDLKSLNEVQSPDCSQGFFKSTNFEINSDQGINQTQPRPNYNNQRVNQPEKQRKSIQLESKTHTETFDCQDIIEQESSDSDQTDQSPKQQNNNNKKQKNKKSNNSSSFESDEDIESQESKQDIQRKQSKYNFQSMIIDTQRGQRTSHKLILTSRNIQQQ